MKHEPSIRSAARAAPAAADYARAKESYASGGNVEHIVVGAWLLTWGDQAYKDFPDWLADRDG